MNTPEFSFQTRRQIWDNLKTAEIQYDTLIIGGGIVGAGLARELALREISCLLVEKNDFASGTSSKSSKLIHGGLRYLEMFDFGLVFEALSERHWLLKTHPHLVHPLQFNLPIYNKQSAFKGMRSPALMSLGLWLYDTLSLFRSPFFHGRHKRNEVLEYFPGICEKGLKSSLYYADAMMLDDEMVLECLYDAFTRGAHSLNYVEVKDVKKTAEHYEVDLQDHSTNTKKKILVKNVVVCVGPWTERIGKHIQGGAVKKLKPSRGVHLILDHRRFPIEHCIVMSAEDKRIVFAIPRNDFSKDSRKVIVGTTDAHEERDPSESLSTAEDIEYLLSMLNKYFPHQHFTHKDILTTYSGVRPLLDEGESESQTSREHEIWKNEEGVVFMAGGKYTTFRKISEELADFVYPNSKAIHRSHLPLSNQKEYEARKSGKPLWGDFSEEWIYWKCSHHMPLTLEDIVFRRIPLWMEGKHLFKDKKATFDRVLEIGRHALSLDDATYKQQKEALEIALKKNIKTVE